MLPAVMLPLCVDLDGTLIRSDVLYESAAVLLRHKPWLAFAMPVWLATGKANLKREIANRASLDVSLLPYNEEFLEWITHEQVRGRALVLATASDQLLVDAIARHLAIFDSVIASDGTKNQKGATKLETLSARFGRNFAYAGNSSADLPIWAGCEEAVLVNAGPLTLQSARALGTVTREFPALPLTYSMVRQVLRARLCQMILIASIPPTLLTSNPLWAAAALAICCLLAGVFVARDLLSLQQDRAVRRPALRPVASGAFPIGVAFLLAPTLVLLGLFGTFYIAARSAG